MRSMLEWGEAASEAGRRVVAGSAGVDEGEAGTLGLVVSLAHPGDQTRRLV